jgi:hypothetical protein
MAKKTLEIPEGLADSAEALRRAAWKGREDDRTTLEVDDPNRRVGSGSPPDEIGETLVREGLITRHQLFNALNEAYRTGGTLEEALCALGMVAPAVLEKYKLS